LVIHIFEPLMIQCLPSGESVAVVRAPSASEPEPGLGQRVGADDLGGGELGQPLGAQRVAAVEDGGQHADAVVRAQRHREAPVARAGLGHQQRRGLVEAEAAVDLWDVDHVEAQLAGLAEQLAHHAGRLGLDVLVVREDLAAPRSRARCDRTCAGPR
jgi:hypothetical protein